MRTKEVTLRQCDTCKGSFPIQNLEPYPNDRAWQYICPRCRINKINHQKKAAGDKTEFVLIEKPRNQRLGEVIVEGSIRTAKKIDNWRHILDHIYDQDTPDMQEKINGLTQ